MKQTLTGLAMIFVGSAIILLKDRIVRLHNALHRSTLGIQLPENWSRGGTIFLGTLMSFYGLLILLRLVTMN